MSATYFALPDARNILIDDIFILESSE